MDDQNEKNNFLVEWMDKYIVQAIAASPTEIHGYVNKLKMQNPGITDDNLAKKIVSRKSVKNGLVGASTGVGGLITLPITVPADIIATWRIQVTTALTIAYVYGHTHQTRDLRTDVYLILGGSVAQESLKKLGIEVGKAITKKMVDKYVTKEVMKKIWKVIPQKIITKAGQKSATSFSKWVPLIGAPIGFAFDYYGTNTLGKIAIKFYSGK